MFVDRGAAAPNTSHHSHHCQFIFGKIQSKISLSKLHEDPNGHDSSRIFQNIPILLADVFEFIVLILQSLHPYLGSIQEFNGQDNAALQLNQILVDPCTNLPFVCYFH